MPPPSRSGEEDSMSERFRRRAWLPLLAVVALALTGAAAAVAARSSKPVVITCSACQNSPTDPFLQFNYKAVQQFNARYRGKYEIKILQNQYAGSGPNRLQYYQ